MGMEATDGVPATLCMPFDMVCVSLRLCMNQEQSGLCFLVYDGNYVGMVVYMARYLGLPSQKSSCPNEVSLHGSQNLFNDL